MRLPRIRPQFSIRWLLVLIAASATLCYVFFVRPTVMAYRFVEVIEQRDYTTARGLLRFDHYPYAGILYDTESISFAYAEVLPRDWNDIWALQRRLILRIRRQVNSDGRHLEFTEDWDVVAHINELKVLVAQANSVRFTPDGKELIREK
ncbi:MAG TPA: hypothetical protein VJ828_11320 [Lacipirellulaceae bacterium]|nr:hypothetical protein [Lacipirellulaceae bacterium]